MRERERTTAELKAKIEADLDVIRQRDHRPLCDGEVIDPSTQLHRGEIPIILEALVVTTSS